MAPDPWADRMDGVSGLSGLGAREAQSELARAFGAAGLEDPARDARLLVLAALCLSAADLVMAPDRPVTAVEAEVLAAAARRRLAREPVSRIVGSRGFYGRVFDITPATLDPRPCTETLIVAALEIAAREGWLDKPIRILDVGTGSGAILVTLLSELPYAVGVGTDISEAALDVARGNAQRLGVGERARFLNRRSLDDVAGPFDLLVSNPPYIDSGTIAELDPEVRDYDPLPALDGGADGLTVYRELAAGLSGCVPEGWAVFEVGAGQADAVAGLLKAAAGEEIETAMWADLGHHIRCVAVRTQR